MSLAQPVTNAKAISPFADAGVALWEAGYSVLPLFPRTKKPGDYFRGRSEGMPKWERFCVTRATEREVERWCHWPHAGLGLPLGPAGGVVAADFDTDDEDWQKKLLSVLPPSPVRKRGARGFTLFYRWNGESSRDFRAPDGTKVVQILSAGRQTALPNSIHPDGMLYVWQTPDTLLDVRPGDLPTLPEDFADIIADVLDPTRKAKRENTNHNHRQRNDDAPTMERVRSALQHIPADDYEIWIQMGMAIRTEFPGGDGFHLWDAWSRTHEKYAKNKSGEIEKRWLGFDESGGPDRVNIDTLFWRALEYGWVEGTQERGPDVPPVDVQPGGNLEAPFRRARGEPEPEPAQPESEAQTEPQREPEIPPEPEPVRELPPEPPPTDDTRATERRSRQRTVSPSVRRLAFSAPGLVGAITRWIERTAPYPQPELSLAAALAVIGTAKAHRVRTVTDLRTNLYMIAVCPPGSGKNHPQKCAKELLTTADLGRNIFGEIVSDAGIFTALSKGEGRLLLAADEYGLFLQVVLTSRAPAHLAKCKSLLMRLFSSADTTFRGPEYSARSRHQKGEDDRGDIDQPCLCLLGSTTEDELYKAITSRDATSGFLGRHLVFVPYRPDPKRNRDLSAFVVPPALVQQVQEIDKWKRNVASLGNVDELLRIRPRIVPFADEARVFLDLALDQFDERKVNAESEALRALWSRAGEHLQKVALIVEEGAHIELATLRWSYQLVTKCIENFCREVRARVADNDRHAEIKRVHRIIRTAGSAGITRTELTRQTQWLGTVKVLDAVLGVLKGGLEVTEESTETGVKIYKALD